MMSTKPLLLFQSYSRQNSFSYDSSSGRTINSRTFRKQKSPVRHRSPSISPSRSVSGPIIRVVFSSVFPR